MDILGEFFKPENFRYLVQISDLVMLSLGIAMVIIALTRSKRSSRRSFFASALLCFAFSAIAYVARIQNWLPEVPETATPSPAQIELTAMTTNVTSYGMSAKVSITNTGKSKRSVTVTGLTVDLKDENAQPDASTFRGHGPGTVNELIVVHGDGSQRRLFYIDENGHCQNGKRATGNLLDALQKPVNISLAPGETYSLIVHNITEKYGVFSAVWQAKYLNFSGQTETVLAKSEPWGSIGGKVSDEEICTESAAIPSAK